MQCSRSHADTERIDGPPTRSESPCFLETFEKLLLPGCDHSTFKFGLHMEGRSPCHGAQTQHLNFHLESANPRRLGKTAHRRQAGPGAQRLSTRAHRQPATACAAQTDGQRPFRPVDSPAHRAPRPPRAWPGAFLPESLNASRYPGVQHSANGHAKGLYLCVKHARNVGIDDLCVFQRL
jgi:hypothetical protein